MTPDVQIVQACQEILRGLQTLDQAIPLCRDAATLRMLSTTLRHCGQQGYLLELGTIDQRDRITEAEDLSRVDKGTLLAGTGSTAPTVGGS